MGRDQCRDPGICVVCCCQFQVCLVEFTCVVSFSCGTGGLLRICEENGIVHEYVWVIYGVALCLLVCPPASSGWVHGGLFVCRDGLLSVILQVGMASSLSRLLYTLCFVQTPLSNCSKSFLYHKGMQATSAVIIAWHV